MERFDVSQLKPGEELLVTTESGSTYHFLAETTPLSLNETRSLFRGLRATRESNHHIKGRPELIENEPALLHAMSGDPDFPLRAGDRMEIMWDRDHPDSKESWDIQFGPKFHDLHTSRIVGIELIPAQE